jgi:hypothetical protein
MDATRDDGGVGESGARIEVRAWLHVERMCGKEVITVERDGWSFVWYGPNNARVVDFGEAGDGVHRFLGRLALMGALSRRDRADS